MPILTNQKEPEPPENSGEPPDYAMRYLFTGERNPQEDLRHAAIVLIISGGLGTLFALFYICFNLELRLSVLLWSLQCLIIACGIRTVYEILSLKRAGSWFAFPPFLLVIASWLLELQAPGIFDGMLNIYFSTPASLALFIGGGLLEILKSNR